MDVLCYPFARGRIFLWEKEIDSGQYDNDDRCFWASGTAIMVRKDYYIGKLGNLMKTFLPYGRNRNPFLETTAYGV
ncbi:MAG: hypothetical protein CM1200mP10_22620 [Candidatus Neomarinimicrobiota bacterium]|nr:MAG: hypothetical protein CM1200mP10_22620 [Candidatus Neomarinimicrobiota bacterium]